MPRTKTGKQRVGLIIMRELERQLKRVLRKMSDSDARVMAIRLIGARNLRARQIVTRTWLEEISAMEQAKLLARIMTPEGQRRMNALMSGIVQ